MVSRMDWACVMLQKMGCLMWCLWWLFLQGASHLYRDSDLWPCNVQSFSSLGTILLRFMVSLPIRQVICVRLHFLKGASPPLARHVPLLVCLEWLVEKWTFWYAVFDRSHPWRSVPLAQRLPNQQTISLPLFFFRAFLRRSIPSSCRLSTLRTRIFTKTCVYFGTCKFISLFTLFFLENLARIGSTLGTRTIP